MTRCAGLLLLLLLTEFDIIAAVRISRSHSADGIIVGMVQLASVECFQPAEVILSILARSLRLRLLSSWLVCEPVEISVPAATACSRAVSGSTIQFCACVCVCVCVSVCVGGGCGVGVGVVVVAAAAVVVVAVVVAVVVVAVFFGNVT